ncbi:decaprenyl-phosphate phosphoribosyltransferase [Paenibacillus sp. UNC451MF]|uniref:decaprenyl-phosphate phosphoribosyltransferase n=1 Tax=Paenibacillus sp. UNC451MF TaxID=1449063 RepID=UPI00056C142D|nr:decaprenyl-phosphate phosphoribosyltransferase [Paenibacillus sp. UNC451MF]
MSSPVLAKDTKDKLDNALPLLLLKQLRPKQWTKNLLVFAALLFSFKDISLSMSLKSLVGFILFCLVSGCVYIINDFVDREADKNHPEKKFRPMASGALNPYLALIFGVFLLAISLVIGFYLNALFSILLSFYFIINVAYSLKLKNVVILDVMIIAAGFVLRAIGGGLVIEVHFTPWFLICTLLLALFLALSKRRHELILLQDSRGSHRKVLEHYSPELINQLNSIVTTATIISYSLFTFTSGRTIQLMWTIPYVLYGIFRYLYLIYMQDKGGSPEKVLLQDKPLQITVVLYALTVAIILYYFE